MELDRHMGRSGRRHMPQRSAYKSVRVPLCTARAQVTMPFHVPLQFWAILYAMSSSKKRSTYAQMSSDVSSFADTSMHTASVNIASDGHR